MLFQRDIALLASVISYTASYNYSPRLNLCDARGRVRNLKVPQLSLIENRRRVVVFNLVRETKLIKHREETLRGAFDRDCMLVRCQLL